MGLTGYYCRFIPDYATVAAPLTGLTKKSYPNKVAWDAKCRDTFERLRQMLCSHPVVVSPDFNWEFILQMDVSDRAVGAALSQIAADGSEHPVGYFSKKPLPSV